MIDELTSKKDAISLLCSQFGVAELSVFGSATRDDFDREPSDIDLLVSFRPMTPFERADAFFGLKDALVELLGVPVDLVVDGALRNRYVVETVMKDLEQLYVA